ncbi:prepilin peptidase [Acetobacter musti]|uniref:Prepilin leader peptidase/N-methyltransferase n=1 Tax=Acetobacter musti TaxID=864732 RepID=A0ABX0JTW0_9PROT|nr:A24 family peptidase [Acetobacter musti]NHN86415.1 prepilin peptidase [Acetobacter musti]
MTLLFLVPFFLAPFIGSFLGVLIRRIPRGEPFATGRSHCEHCGTTLRPAEMIPVLSYCLQKGRCRHCGSRIDAQHLRVELAALGVPVSIVLCGLMMSFQHELPFDAIMPEPGVFLADCILGWGLLALSWIDLICLRLPDSLTLPLLLAGLAEGFIFHGPEGAYDRVLGCAAGWLIFTAIAWGYRRLRGRTGLGGGDVKLLAAGGAWLGVAPLPSVILLAAILGLIAAATTIFRSGRFSMTVVVPFGPCLAAAVWMARLVLSAE